MYLLLITVCALVIWYLVECLKWWRSIFRHMEKLPGLRWYPLIGTMYAYFGVPRTEVFSIYLAMANKYKPVWRCWNGSDAELHVTKPQHMEIILKSPIQLNKGKRYDLLHPWLGEGLLTSKGSKWHHHRKLITPSFHFKILESFMDIFVDKSKHLVEYLETKADGNFFDVHTTITNCALDIICETAMGVPVNAMSNMQTDYVKSIHDICELTLWRSLRPYLKWNSIFYLFPQGRKFREAVRTLHEFSNKVIADRREQRLHSKMTMEDENSGCKKLSFLDLLLEASEEKNIMSSADLRDEVDTFIFEGHDATTAALSWSLFLLGNYPEIQEKALEEIRGVLQDKSTPTTLSELNKLKYLECVIKETLRLYPSFPFIGRSLSKDINIDGYNIPANVQVVLDIYSCHRDPEQFPDPNKFDPDRFLYDHGKIRHPYAFIPFSGGPRNCIGQKFAMYKIKTVLSSIIKNYKITSQEAHNDVKVFADIILRSQNGVGLKLEKRHW